MTQRDGISGLCECGCGTPTKVAAHNDRSKGWVKGVPLRFVRGHDLRARSVGGPLNRNWKGGRHLSPHGYVMLTMPDGSREYEHIVVAEQALGRRLHNHGKGNSNTEVVHHIDGDKANNAKNNLLICTHAYHTALHHRLERSPEWPQFRPVVRGLNARKS